MIHLITGAYITVLSCLCFRGLVEGVEVQETSATLIVHHSLIGISLVAVGTVSDKLTKVRVYHIF